MPLVRTIVTFLVCIAIIAGISALTGGALSFSYWDVAAIGVIVIVLQAAVSRTLSFRSFYRLGEQDR